MGFKVGEYSFITEDRHKRRHWIDAFNKLYSRMSIPDKVFNTDDKENLLNNTESDSNNRITRTSLSRRTSTSSINDNHFSFSIRKSLLKQKRNSIGYI